MGSMLEILSSVFGGVVVFIVTRALVDGLDNSTWSTAEVTMVETILPLVLAMACVFGVFRMFRGKLS